jgi:23S rRNA (uracil1939-C5)-methyltransferase
MEYQEQLEKKQRYVQGLFGGLKAEPAIGMEDPLHYRHKVYATFGYDEHRRLMAGMYEEESHRLVLSQDCMIQSETANRILQSIVRIAGFMHIEPYQEDFHRGVLRHAYLRVSRKSGRVLLVLVIGSRELPGSRVFIHRIMEENPEIESVVLNWNNHHTSMILGSREKVLIGKGTVEDEIAGLVFRISSHSFYQVNPAQTEKLYSAALEMAELTGTEKVLDACCGIGTISLLAARQAAEVTGVEITPAAVEDAKENAYRNHIANAKFICQDAEEYLLTCHEHFDIVFLDPPRAGFSKEFLDALARIRPKRIIYIACDPSTQARDTKYLRTRNYVVQKIQPVDMFPFTKHVETVVLMSRVENQP